MSECKDEGGLTTRLNSGHDWGESTSLDLRARDLACSDSGVLWRASLRTGCESRMEPEAATGFIDAELTGLFAQALAFGARR
jgi:hypothetical protein